MLNDHTFGAYKCLLISRKMREATKGAWSTGNTEMTNKSTMSIGAIYSQQRCYLKDWTYDSLIECSPSI